MMLPALPPTWIQARHLVCEKNGVTDAETYAVLDFETTGLSPNFDRVIEVGVVLVQNHAVVETYSELMDPGFAIPSHITS